MWRSLVLVVACGGSPRPAPAVPVEHPHAHYRNAQYKLGAVIDLADSEHPVIQLDGDRAPERLERRGIGYVDQAGRPILRLLDADSVVVFVHGGGVGVAMGRDRDL